jgi:hypothetical protein
MDEGPGFLWVSPGPFATPKNRSNCSCVRAAAFVSFSHRPAGFALSPYNSVKPVPMFFGEPGSTCLQHPPGSRLLRVLL